MNKEKIQKLKEATVVFKVLSDPTRLKILYLLSESKDGLCVYEIASELQISHSAASHQLANLEARRIVCGFREGQSMCYKLSHTPLTKTILRIIKLS